MSLRRLSADVAELIAIPLLITMPIPVITFGDPGDHVPAIRVITLRRSG